MRRGNIIIGRKLEGARIRLYQTTGDKFPSLKMRGYICDRTFRDCIVLRVNKEDMPQKGHIGHKKI